MQTLNGKELAEQIFNKTTRSIEESGFQPRLDIIFVGHDAGSEIYVQKKKQAGTRVGVKVEVHNFEVGPETDMQVKALTRELANNDEVHGLMLQLPAPGIDVPGVFDLIPVNKDVDGLNPTTLGLLWHHRAGLVPATAQAVIEALNFMAAASTMEDLQNWLTGKNILIINRTVIIGQPLAAILTNLNATVSIAHSKTVNLDAFIKQSDLVISGAGVPGLITADNLKPGAIVIDAAFTKTDSGISGDVGYNDISNKAAWLSPVPNGIGPLGVACLIANTVKAAQASCKV